MTPEKQNSIVSPSKIKSRESRMKRVRRLSQSNVKISSKLTHQFEQAFQRVQETNPDLLTLRCFLHWKKMYVKNHSCKIPTSGSGTKKEQKEGAPDAKSVQQQQSKTPPQNDEGNNDGANNTTESTVIEVIEVNDNNNKSLSLTTTTAFFLGAVSGAIVVAAITMYWIHGGGAKNTTQQKK